PPRSPPFPYTTLFRSVFCQTKRVCDQVSTALRGRGFAAAAVHGDLGQSQRERALRAFRNGKIDVLVATDVAARGLDVDDVTHVANYECPDDEKIYTHRIGRTGRAGRSGTAVTFVEWREIARWKLIKAALELSFPVPEETYSTSPHFFEQLGIPEGTKGRLAKEKQERVGLEAEEIEDIGDTGVHAKQREQREPRDRDRGGRSRNRNRRRTRKGAEAAAPDAPARTEPAGGDGEAAPAPRRRRRRRTRSGVEVGRGQEGTAQEG